MPSREWAKNNQEYLRAYERRRYAERVAHRAEVAQWKREHPEAKQRENALRLARQSGVRTNFTGPIRLQLWLRQMGECGLCGAGMERMEIDHVVPLCAGGPHELDNVHLVHPECNRKKGRRLHAV